MYVRLSDEYSNKTTEGNWRFTCNVYVAMDKIRQLINKRLPAGSFARNVVTLMSGTTFAQVLLILVAPILTRLYSPGDFGVYSLYTSILGILAVIACWRYELAIVLPEKDEDAANLLVLSICICLGMAALTLLVVAFFRNPVAKLLGAPELTTWLWFLPLSLIAVGFFQAFNYWSTRQKQFKRLATRTITQSIVIATAQIGTGVVHPTVSAGGLIGGSILGQLSATGRLAWQIWRDEGKQLVSYIKCRDIYNMGNRFKKFPIYDSGAGLLNTTTTMLPALLLGYFFTPTIVGYYALGHRVLSMPMVVIGGSIAQAFFPKATEARRRGNLDRITFVMFEQLLKVGMVPILLLAIVAPELFTLIFGSHWWTAGKYVQWLSLWMLFVFISSPLSTLFSVLERQKESLLINIAQFITRLIALIIGGYLNDPYLAISMFGMVNAILVIFACFYILNLAGISLKAVILKILNISLQNSIYLLIPIVLKVYGTNDLTLVLSSFLMGLTFIIVNAKRFGPQININ